MSFGTTLSNIFSGVNPNPPAAPAAPTGAQVQQPATQIPANAGETAPQTPGMATNGVVPLDAHKDLWNTPANQQAPAEPTVFGDIDTKAVLDKANQIDFTAALTPEIEAKIAAGGQEGVAALRHVLQSAAAQSHAQSSVTAAKLGELVAKEARAQVEKALPNHMRNIQADQLIRQNTILSHPAVSPMISSLSQQIQLKYPDATAEQIKQHAERYVVDFVNSVNQQSAASNPSNPSNSTEDWEKFFE